MGEAEAAIFAGVSYDLLKDPTNVSFEYPEGFLSFNIPVDLGDFLPEQEYDLGGDQAFSPRLGIRQDLNYSFRINIPMLGGVFSYGNVHNVNLGYSVILGNSNLDLDTTIQDLFNFRIAGRLNVPLFYNMTWKTQTFGYAFRPFKSLTIGLNLHQHIFEIIGAGNISSNIVGGAVVSIDTLGFQQKTNIAISYDNSQVFGSMEGRYSGSAWTPALGIRLGRLGYTARMGIHEQVEGELTAKYSVPFFIDAATFEPDLGDLDFLTESSDSSDTSSSAKIENPLAILGKVKSFVARIEGGETDSVVYRTKKPLIFNVPDGHTFYLNILKSGKLYFAYTKILGEISGFHQYEGGALITTVDSVTGDTTTRKEGEGVRDLDFGFRIDNVFIFAGRFNIFRFNLGIFTMDFREKDNEDLIGGLGVLPEFQGDPIFPIFSLSALMGSTTKFLGELDLLPIPSVKVGLLYYF